MLPVELQSIILTYINCQTLEQIASINKEYLYYVQEHTIRYPKQINHLSMLLHLLLDKVYQRYNVTFYYLYECSLTITITYVDPQRRYYSSGVNFDKDEASMHGFPPGSKKRNILSVLYHSSRTLKLSYQQRTLGDASHIYDVIRCYREYDWDINILVLNKVFFVVVFEDVRWKSKFTSDSNLTWKDVLDNLDLA